MKIARVRRKEATNVGAHHRKSKTGHLSLSRAERDYLDTCFHEATHAVVGIAEGLKLSDRGVFAYDPRYPADRFAMKMAGATGLTTWDKGSYETVEERDPLSLVNMGRAPEVHLQNLPWIDKHLLSRVTSSDKKHNEALLSRISPDDLDAVQKLFIEFDLLKDPAEVSLFSTQFLLALPSIKEAIDEVAKRLHEKKRLFDAEVREILIHSFESNSKADLECLRVHSDITEKQHFESTTQWIEEIKKGGQR